ncbi:SRPBCC family protein [Lacisediminihabitans sp.]|uniref:SRPBCC family protein n=1 Tax=Lacisediminihabitans sp. TaxID=2787631 RepID=UPI00374DB783
MTTVTAARTFSASAERLWALMGDFYTIDTWMVGVAAVSKVAENTRRVSLAGGAGELLEELLEERQGFQRYRFTDPGPIPVANYVAELTLDTVSPDESRLTWTAQFDPAGVPEEVARGAVESNFSNSLQALDDLIHA